MWAVRNTHLGVASWLQERGAQLGAVTKSGTNLLHWAIWSVRDQQPLPPNLVPPNFPRLLKYT